MGSIECVKSCVCLIVLSSNTDVVLLRNIAFVIGFSVFLFVFFFFFFSLSDVLFLSCVDVPCVGSSSCRVCFLMEGLVTVFLFCFYMLI